VPESAGTVGSAADPVCLPLPTINILMMYIICTYTHPHIWCSIPRQYKERVLQLCRSPRREAFIHLFKLVGRLRPQITVSLASEPETEVRERSLRRHPCFVSCHFTRYHRQKLLTLSLLRSIPFPFCEGCFVKSKD
jgi:hypothetical protein